MKPYVVRKWLNKPNQSTGTVVAYHGPSQWDDINILTFLEVSDCHCKVRLHKTHKDSMSEFVAKMRTLARTANEFADFLENNHG